MDRHAGFAAALSIRQQTLQDFIRVLHHANQLPHTLIGAAAGISASLFLEAPQLVCGVARGNRLELNLTARGPLVITAPGESPASRTVLVRARVLVPPLLSLESASLTFRVDGANAVLDSLDIDPLAGGAYPPGAQAIIDSDAFFNGFQSIIRAQLTSLPRLTPPISVGFLGPIATASGATVTPRVIDGALAVGIDVSGASGVTTHGNPSLLIDTTAGNDIGMWTNPAALPLVMADVRTRIVSEVNKADATLTSLSFSAREGQLHISGGASKGSEGSVSFSLDAVPHLIRPGHHEEWDEEYGEHFEINTAAREELWFEATNVDVDIDRPWWSYVLSVLGVFFTFGIGTLIIEAIVEMIRNNISSGISGSSGSKVADRVQTFTFAGTTEPSFQMKIETYECHVEGIFVGITLRPNFRTPGVDGPTAIALEEVNDTNLVFHLRLPFDAHPDDPMLSVRWTVRRADTNAIIRNIDVQARAGLTLDITADPALLSAPELRIACRVYSTLGPITTDLLNSTVTLRIADPFDRSHPYVKWHHEVFTPIVRVEADGSHGSHTQLGFRVTARTSDIHRTDFPGRCKMVSRFSGKVSRTDMGADWPHLEYLDALPFPIEDLVTRRAQVCDYCFFGGPTKTTPLI